MFLALKNALVSLANFFTQFWCQAPAIEHDRDWYLNSWGLITRDVDRLRIHRDEAERPWADPIYSAETLGEAFLYLFACTPLQEVVVPNLPVRAIPGPRSTPPSLTQMPSRGQPPSSHIARRTITTRNMARIKPPANCTQIHRWPVFFRVSTHQCICLNLDFHTRKAPRIQTNAMMPSNLRDRDV
ncbi:hypothetical protein B0H14DRAFT_2560673 [Mycena olivaceomarginata]|nr:hypothetical protein B0H14DRAFT_2560673 [Mycena olivaceomarginata]